MQKPPDPAMQRVKISHFFTNGRTYMFSVKPQPTRAEPVPEVLPHIVVA